MSPAAGVPRVAGLVLAAGASRRFGAPKQLAPLEGRPLLEHALAAIAGARGVAPVLVALGAHAEQILAAVDLHGARPLLVPGWEEGQAASLRAGVAALAPQADAIVVTLGDQPRVDAALIERIAAYAGAAPLAGEGEDAPARTAGERSASGGGAAPLAARATFGGIPGHPVLLRAPLFAAVSDLRGDAGARGLLDPATTVAVACGAGAVLDVDTPRQLRRL